jgi:hypothetical protein
MLVEYLSLAKVTVSSLGHNNTCNVSIDQTSDTVLHTMSGTHVRLAQLDYPQRWLLEFTARAVIRLDTGLMDIPL